MSTPPDESSGTPQRPHIRIGTDERDAAMRALDAHLNAGRLDPDEYGDRMAKVSVARTRDDLDALFTDLPAPGPTSSGPAGYPGPASSDTPRYSAPQPYSAPAPPPAQRPDRNENALGGRTGATIVALSPLIALVLFFATHWWVWFLLIPAVGAIVYGGGRDRRRSR